MTERNDNPYASPQGKDEPPAVSSSAYREGKFVVTHNKAQMPQRCWICNQPGRNQWNIAMLGAFTTEGIKNLAVTGFRCDKHERRIKIAGRLEIGVAVLVISLAMGIGTLVSRLRLAEAIGVVLLVSLLGFYFLVAHRIKKWVGASLTTIEFRRGSIRLRGAGQPFLDSLPDHPVGPHSDNPTM